MFGLTLIRTSRLHSADQPVPAVDADGNPISQAKLFSSQYAAGAAVEMLGDIKRNKRDAEKVTKLVLSVTTPHQIGFLLLLAWPHISWATPWGIASMVTMLAMAVLGPVAVDYLTLICIRNVTSKGLKTSSLVWSGGMMMMPVAFSAWINFAAPAPMEFKILAAFLVTLIPGSQIVRAMGSRPDFAKLARGEQEILDQVATKQEPLAPGRLSDEERERRNQTRLFNDYTDRWDTARRKKYRDEHGGAVPKKPTRDSVQAALAARTGLHLPADLETAGSIPVSAAPNR